MSLWTNKTAKVTVPAIGAWMRKLKAGDTLVIKSIDRLGRICDEILEQRRLLARDKQVLSYTLSQSLEVDFALETVEKLVKRQFSIFTLRKSFRKQEKPAFSAEKAGSSWNKRSKSILLFIS